MRLSNEAGTRSQARHGALLVRISDPLSHILQCAKRRRRGGVAARHVRVIPARLLNFGSHKVIVYGCFTVVKLKAVWHFAFSAFVIFVKVSAQEIWTEKVFKGLNMQKLRMSN